MPDQIRAPRLGWRWNVAALLFAAGLIGLLSGVGVSERPDVVQASLLTKAYYTLGLFVVGGLDLGTPEGGPLIGRVLLWSAYFGAPLLTASAVIEAVVRLVAQRRWKLRRLRDHLVIAGTGQLTRGVLQEFRARQPKAGVLVVSDGTDKLADQEYAEAFGATVIVGDITQDFLLRRLRLGVARRILLLGANDFESFEAASRIVALRPKAAQRLVLHCHNLRFLRSLEDTELVQRFSTFNTYNMAARGLVHDHLLQHFHKTTARDVVVLAGFGRFGQTVLEELDERFPNEIERVAIIDSDAERRMLVVEEQHRLAHHAQRDVLQGDIAHPEVWTRLAELIDLGIGEPVVILGTGSAEQNLRSAIWLKQLYPNAHIYVRTNSTSSFALDMATEYDIHCISIAQLMQDALPEAWLS